ncbi:hypothetical protein Bcav_2625 [Beutenbergia cavernae DSM 12333]|uniref:Uncharacterized protein n=1 Tax=Beutenbergia cavernae (strain ATCC BAA-8 / DSM 12333 / CCUG 43141 / JCM 11478 / NBRC 16432 / NCIMB 13614 / HKI 0122) TaxID=471853 RepID=C5BXI7_BEUC1|nr:hypothetical protein [Beutenbergia cavernae]ACQ80870.1 hypothetical protein Bcav_2625 [Beutenbergia cavernae DSM 12333]
MADQRRRRVITVAILAAVDVVLLIVLLVLLLGQGPGGDPGDDPTETASGDAGASAVPTPSATPPEGAVEIASFVTPSGNIGCDMSGDGVTCRIGDYTFTPPPADGCTGTVGGVVELDAEGTDVPCVAEVPPVSAPDAAVLDYGESSAVGGYACTSERTGLRCLSLETGHGFVLARAALTEF